MLKKLLMAMSLSCLFFTVGCGGSEGGVVVDETTDMKQYDSDVPEDYDATKDPDSSSYTGK